MSNHPSTTIKSRLLRRGLAGILSLALLLSLIPSSILTAGAAGWEDQYIQTLVDWGVMRGDIGGNMAPQRSITRAEFVTMMNRAYGYKKMGGHPFTDVSPTSWYNEDIDIGYNIGYFKGTSPTTASPNDTLTREQAAVLLARNMMLQPTVGETLGFSDSRTLSDWSRGLVGAAAENGIISGYDDGTFQPFRNITRGEVAAMLVRAIGTPVQEAGDHALGNVYGNVTVNTAGVKLRDGVIAGNLYLTGGIDLGDVLLENVTVLGQIIVSGGGESNSSESSVVLRNVVADGMIVDSIGEQFVTIRAEGNTDIPTTTVRTNAYVDDSSLPGYGLSYIELDGAEGALYQLAGNIKDVINKTPGSDMQIVQGSAGKVTVDEEARDSSVLVDGDARVDELNLDTAANVTGTGDIKNLNVGAAGSTVEQLPDKIVIRPGITADIAGSSMNSTQGAQSSAEPKLLAGYPAVRKIAPQSAELVFRVNKPGTIYWAVSAVADGSVSEADLLEPPVYGNKVLASGRVTATAANTDYTAAVNRLTSGGSYYVTAMLVDGRGEHSPIKVTSFTTPDDSVPAFADGYPVMTLVTTEISQVTVMTTKSCLLYYALLPKGAKAPTEAEFKAAAIPGNLGYGSQSVTKNVTIPINVNSVPLEEKTDYVLYLWLVDHDGAQKSRVTALPFTTLDETPPNVTYIDQTNAGASSVTVEYTIDEDPADLIWAIVTESDDRDHVFLNYEWEAQPEPGNENRFTLNFTSEADLRAAKTKLFNGSGALANGKSSRSPATMSNSKLSYQNAQTSSFVLYYIAHDRATASANLSEQIKALRVHTLDQTDPTVELRFTNPDGSDIAEMPQADADIRIIFSENVQNGNTSASRSFLSLYEAVTSAEKDMIASGEDPNGSGDKATAYNTARKILGDALRARITMYNGTAPNTTSPVHDVLEDGAPAADTLSWVDWSKAQVEMLSGGKVEVRLPNAGNPKNDDPAVKIKGGTSYYFHLAGIFDMAVFPNPRPLATTDLQFSTSFAKVLLTDGNTWTIDNASGVDFSDSTQFPNASKNNPQRIDVIYQAKPTSTDSVDKSILWDMLVWTNTSMTFTLYSRPIDANGNPTGTGVWTQEGKDISIIVHESDGNGDGYAFLSLNRIIRRESEPTFDTLWNMTPMEYAIHIDRLGNNSDKDTWNDQDVNFRVSVVADTERGLRNLSGQSFKDQYDAAIDRSKKGTVTPIGEPDFYEYNVPFTDTSAPGLSGQYPSINLTNEDGDTKATINVRLTGPGTLYYLIFPLTSLTNASGPINTKQQQLTEGTNGLINTITNYDCAVGIYKTGSDDKVLVKDIPVMFNDPNWNAAATKPTVTAGVTTGLPSSIPVVTDVTTEEYDDGIVAQSYITYNSGNTTRSINLENLTPNTIYAVCLVTRGVSATYSNSVQCFRFVTKEAIRPTIDINGATSSSVNVNLDRSTELWYRLAANGSEGTQLQNKFYGSANHTAGDNPWAITSTGTAQGGEWGTMAPTDKGDFSNGTYTFNFTEKSIGDMTVIDAMATPCYRANASGNNYEGSVFDIFATDNVKSTYSGLIQGNSISGETLAMYGHNTYPAGDNSIPCTGMTAGVYYTFLTVGKGATGSGYSFRAYYSVRPADNDAPIIQSASRGGSNWTVDANGKLPNNSTVTIYFTEGLWALDSGSGSSSSTQTAYALDSCAGGSSDHPVHTKPGDFIALGNIIRCPFGIEPVYAAKHDSKASKDGITYIELKLTDFSVDTPYNINFNANICDSAKNGLNRGLLNIKIEYVQTNKGEMLPDGTTAAPAKYELRVTAPSSWGGTVLG